MFRPVFRVYSFRHLLLIVFFIATHNSASSQIFLKDRFPALQFSGPVGVYHPNDLTERLCVVEQGGTIRIFPDDTTVTTAKVFLDISDSVISGGELGLLGLAFHPNYAVNGCIYVDYTKNNPLRSVISRFKVSATNPDSIDRSSEFVLLEQLQPFENHNGGQLAFGPDGYLYIAFGDGGSGSDPFGNGQSRSTFLGKILRINVDSSAGPLHYAIPPDNPFFGDGTKKQEIYAYGLRNPWRFSFDGSALWCADVGQDQWEEIDTIQNGRDYGWNIMEGFHCYNPSSGCDTTGLMLPLWEYHHESGRCAITGGFIYRGTGIPQLAGKYIYGDYCTGEVWTLTPVPSLPVVNSFLLSSGVNISSFGLDRHNELYVCDVSGGKIYKFLTSSPGPVVLLSPLNGAINQPKLSTCVWSTAVGASAYQLQIATDSAFTTFVVNDSTISDTTKQVGPLADSTLYFWRVRPRSGAGPGAFTPFRKFMTAGSSAQYPVSKYWNLLSLPLDIAGARQSVLYPTANSNAFIYNPGSGYVVTDSLFPGTGFWLKFPDDEMIGMTGPNRLTDTIDVVDGWNIVGSVSQPVAVTQLTSIPGGLVTSQFFGYRSGYIQSDTIIPGEGYWVKVTGGGKLIVSAGSGAEGKIKIRTIDELPPLPPGGKSGQPGRAIPDRYRLGQNYPNPFNPTTLISYDVPVSGRVALRVFNLIGQEVATLIDGDQDAGSYQLSFDGSRYPSGLYFYRMTAGSYTDIKKMVLLK